MEWKFPYIISSLKLWLSNPFRVLTYVIGKLACQGFKNNLLTRILGIKKQKQVGLVVPGPVVPIVSGTGMKDREKKKDTRSHPVSSWIV